MREYSDVVIVGGGASGLLCGGIMAEYGASVTIIEKNDRVGKKLSATGNGRCNFTNRHMQADCFYGDREWIGKVLCAYGPEDAIRQFNHIGVYHREKDGYLYPYTNQAATVVDALHRMCEKNHVALVTECRVTALKKEADGYCVRTSEGEIRCRFLVLAAGGKAAEELGGSGSGYKLARSLGHTLQPIYPGLTGLVCEGGIWKKTAGTRIFGRFSLWTGDTWMAGECGEIQIVKEGVSGIPVFQMCRQAAKALADGKTVQGEIDFVPSMTEQDVYKWLNQYSLDGLVPKKWIPVLKNHAELPQYLKRFRFFVRDTFGLERAQVTAGGVTTEEVSAETMESKVAPGVFLIGEILDADGKCGGYNLHFAWATAALAAREMKKRIEE